MAFACQMCRLVSQHQHYCGMVLASNAGMQNAIHCMYATAGSLKELVGRCASREEKVALLSFEVSYGCIDGWRIELSTLPGRVGQSVMHSACTLSEVKDPSTRKSKSLFVGAHCPEGGWVCPA